MSYEGAWRNRPHQPYEQYCYPHEAPQKILQLIEKYGSAFDDQWYYKKAGKTQTVIIRRPLWATKTAGGWLLEKPNHHNPTHKKTL